jgi:WD40-like Beta Propeller Repeat
MAISSVRIALGTTAIGVFALAVPAVTAKNFTAWSPPVNAETLPGSSTDLNTSSNDGCPIQAPDGLTLFIASNRPGGLGGQDIWFARRDSTSSGWGTPVNPGAPVNSAADDFCPTPVHGNRLFFVSKRADPAGDIYLTRKQMGIGRRQGLEVLQDIWDEPILLDQVNSTAEEWSPSYFETGDGHEVLYFSSTRAGGQDIWYSVDYGPAQLAAGGVNASGAADARPNVRKDGLEIVWDSNRAGGLGGQDIWTATRASTSDPWGPAVHLGGLNSAVNETRASLSWDGETMVFGSNRPGSEGAADVYISQRTKIAGNPAAN